MVDIAEYYSNYPGIIPCCSHFGWVYRKKRSGRSTFNSIRISYGIDWIGYFINFLIMEL